MKLKGVGRRKDGSLHFEMRCDHGKLFSSQIKTEEEGALCYDFVLLYSEMQMESVVGGKRKSAKKLNYPEYSRSLQLASLLSGLDFQNNKEMAMAIILNEARAAAANLPENLRRSIMAAGDPSPSNRSSSHQQVYRKSPYVSEGKQDLPTIEVLKTFWEIDKQNNGCFLSLSLKLKERQKLEIKVAGIEEGSGFISIPDPGPETFYDLTACLKQLLCREGRISGFLEEALQVYKSEESKCSMLRKILEDHNSKVVDARLMSPENRMAGRQRSSENERLPHVPEPCPPEEQDDFGVPVGESETSGPPASPPAIVTPGGTHTTMAPVGMDMPLIVVPLEPTTIAVGPPNLTECQWEDIAEWIEELRSSSPDCSHNTF